MKVKLRRDAGVVMELPTPPELDTDDEDEGIGFDEKSNRRRSLQVSIPDVTAIILIHIFAKIVGISFSLLIRELLKPYLEVVIEVLSEEGLLNSYGNIIYNPEKMYQIVSERHLNVKLLKSFIDKCKAKGLSVGWVSTVSL